MKKILFISPRNPFSGRYSGDVVRAKKFVYFLSRDNYVKVISPDKFDCKKKESRLSYEGFSDTNLILKLFYIIFSLLKLKPLQLGYFYSSKINEYVKNNHKNYDLIFCQSFRTAQYIPENFSKKTILDMGDLTSNNYKQTSNRLYFFNPAKLIYYIESLLLKRYENFCFNKFHKILLFSKKEINTIKKKYKRKITQIYFGVDGVKKKYKFHVKNYKIIFIGNIKYTPNKSACFEFANTILPLIFKVHPNIEFHIIGEISKFDKFFLQQKHNVKVIGKVNNLEPYIDKTICGLANLKISSGVQTKLLTYMSYGVPSVCSQQVADNFDAIKESKINFYKNNKDLVKIILKLKNNKDFSLEASKRSLKIIQKFKWDRILTLFNKILK
jgi:hypothetical protein